MTFVPPLAPQATPQGTRFRVLSAAAERLHLLLYDGPRDHAPARTLVLERETHCENHLWEIAVPGVAPGQLYNWAVDPAHPLLDPYALALSGPERFGVRGAARRRGNRDAVFKSAVVAPPPPVNWKRPPHAWPDTVICELHVRGATRHPSSGVANPGTYRGLAEKAHYFRDLGVTAVELMPVHEFDETEGRHGNFWGYSPVGWFAPMRRYAAAADEPARPIEEFRAMVRAFHEHGLEVFVDGVFNHSAEGRATGPLWHLRGLDDRAYYLHDEKGAYVDRTGCGNTLNVDHPWVRNLIRDALRWWVHGLGVDGFRLDLAGVLARSPDLIREIESDPYLEGVRLIAEAWDAAGEWRVDDWPGNEAWSVWNDRFRDDVRRAWLADPHYAPALATRLCGSSDLFASGPPRGVNYVTCHDGFTLLDAVSYTRKHNEANGEDNRDGHPHEISASHGPEGPSGAQRVRAARDRARRNLVASLLLAQGVPMLVLGDELGRTQRGNNNPYCHDSELTWVDWTGLEKDHAFHRFVRGLVHLRRDTALLRRTRFLLGGDAGDIRWLGPAGGGVDWEGDPGHFGYVLSGAETDEPDLLVLVNLLPRRRTYALPGGTWSLVVETAAAPPADFHEPAAAVPHEGEFVVAGKSLAVFRAQTDWPQGDGSR